MVLVSKGSTRGLSYLGTTSLTVTYTLLLHVDIVNSYRSLILGSVKRISVLRGDSPFETWSSVEMR